MHLFSLLFSFACVILEFSTAFIIPLSITTCPKSGNGFEFHPNLKEVGNELFFDGTFATTSVPEDTTLNMEIEMWNGADWVQMSSIDGTMCDYVKKLDKAFDRMKKTVVPPIEEQCYIPAGEYTLENYQVTEDEVEVLSHVSPGKYRVKVVFYFEGDSGENVDQACMLVEAEVTS